MNIILKIPKEFEEHYNRERFKDSLERINLDIRSLKFEGLSGTYDYEVVEMLITAFSYSIPMSSCMGKLCLNSMYGLSAISAYTDKGFMKEGN